MAVAKKTSYKLWLAEFLTFCQFLRVSTVGTPRWHIVIVAGVRDYRCVGWFGPVGEVAHNTLQIAILVVGERRQGLVTVFLELVLVVAIAEAVILAQILRVVPVDPLEVGHLLPAMLLHKSDHSISSCVIGCRVDSVVPHSRLASNVLVQKGASWGWLLI